MIRLLVKKRLLKTLVFLLEFLAVAMIAYLVISLSFPKAKYWLLSRSTASQIEWQDLTEMKEEVAKLENHLPNNNNLAKPADVKNTLVNRIIIPKIGVNSPIIESEDAEYALDRGAWRTPKTSTPDKGSNTVISGHRYKYLPPNNLTFYLLDKLIIGDIILAVWQGEDYYYRVKEKKIVEPTEVSILNPTDVPTLTLYTCDPIYSQEHRLVVIAEQIEK